jgi:tRNA threonylcarbamoyladenosine biosynthesis protein TsaB
VITIAIDTSEARGSVALLREGTAVACVRHADSSDYSEWLLPAVDRALADAGVKMELVDLLAASTGPGSFTGLRVGLTTVKAWAEVYGKRVVGVSRLEALGRSVETRTEFVASCYDAQRGQLFGGFYRSEPACLKQLEDEVVASPEEFVRMVAEGARQGRVTWAALDADLLRNVDFMRPRLEAGDVLVAASSELAPTIGMIAASRARVGEFSDPVTLDANYVRRSDAEIFWKGPSAGVL